MDETIAKPADGLFDSRVLVCSAPHMFSAADNSPPILLTGSHRSGSSWLGLLLGATPEAVVVREPFNPVFGLHKLFCYWFTYINEGNAATYQPLLDDVVAWRGALHWRQFYTFRLMMPYYRACLRRRPEQRLLFVDPVAAYSCVWLHQRYGFRVIVLWRHPAAFVASLKRLNWRFDFANWLDQDRLMSEHLQPFARYYREPIDLVEEGAWVWRSIYHVLLCYQEQYDSFITLRHEDIANSPHEIMRRLCSQLDLTYSDKVDRAITETTGETLPLEGPAGSYDNLYRHSAAVVDKWQGALQAEEIERIRTITAPVADHMYSSESWQLS